MSQYAYPQQVLALASSDHGIPTKRVHENARASVCTLPRNRTLERTQTFQTTIVEFPGKLSETCKFKSIKMPLAVNKININEQIFVKYSCWWDNLEIAKTKFADIGKIVVRGTIIAVDFEKRIVTICFPSLMETRKEHFSFFSNLSVHTNIKKSFRELQLEEFLKCTGVYRTKLEKVW
jgi:hypothetical protein